MKAEHFRSMTKEQREEYALICAARGNYGAMMELSAFIKYLDKPVKVVKGRKVPISTTGICFWIGMKNYSKYGNWWSWNVRVGFKDEYGNAYFTSEENIALA